MPDDVLPSVVAGKAETIGGVEFSLGDACRLSGERLTDGWLRRGGRHQHLWLGDDLIVVVTGIGSNFVEVKWPSLYVGSSNNPDVNDASLRLHSNELHHLSILAPDMLASYLAGVQTEATARLAELTAQASAMVNSQIPSSSDRVQSDGGGALIALNQCQSPAVVKQNLEHVRDVGLPEVYKSIAIAVGQTRMVMQFQLLTMTAKIRPMKDMIEVVGAKLFTIELYAGIHENVRHFRTGAPAPADEKLCVFQRMVYMDEESLLDYQSGGMDFQSVDEWDEWLAQPDNLARIMPFPRTMMIARVRRLKKERETHTLTEVFAKINEEKADKKTFIYIRNGENLYRISTGIDFGARAFPDPSVVHQSEEMVFERFASSVSRVIPKRVWEVEYEDRTRMSRSWHPLNPTSVYYDDAMAFLKTETDAFQRFGLILQGLFDRSDVFRPCPAVKMWDEQSFSDHVRLILDSDRSLYSGEEPDFEAYRHELNSRATADSVFIGHRDYWLRQEAAKENARQRKDYRIKTPTIYVRFSPWDDEGPALMLSGRPMRGGRVAFQWEKHDYGSRRGPKTRSVTVPLSELLNLSAYRKGDYKRFFSDPRTREKYLTWAPLLLAGEDFIAAQEDGKIPNGLGREGYSGRSREVL